MIYKSPPSDFNSKFDIVSCFVQKGDEILLLHRQDHKPQGNTWGIPAGKVDNGEGFLQAAQRELREETGISTPIDQLLYVGKIYNRYPELDFVFHMFKTSVDIKTNVTISPNEHKAYVWIQPQKARSLNLMEDIGDCIDQFCK